MCVQEGGDFSATGFWPGLYETLSMRCVFPPMEHTSESLERLFITDSPILTFLWQQRAWFGTYRLHVWLCPSPPPWQRETEKDRDTYRDTKSQRETQSQRDRESQRETQRECLALNLVLWEGLAILAPVMHSDQALLESKGLFTDVHVLLSRFFTHTPVQWVRAPLGVTSCVGRHRHNFLVSPTVGFCL